MGQCRAGVKRAVALALTSATVCATLETMDPVFWCAWCSEAVETPTVLNEVAFHWVSLKRRMRALKDEKQDAGRRPKKLAARVALRRAR